MVSKKQSVLTDLLAQLVPQSKALSDFDARNADARQLLAVSVAA